MTISEIFDQAASLPRKEVDAIEVSMLKEYRKALDEQLEALRRLYADMATIKPEDRMTWAMKYNRLTGLIAKLQESYKVAAKKAGRLTYTAVEDALLSTYYRTMYAASWAIDYPAVAMVLPDAVVQASVYGTTDVWAGLQASTAEKIVATYGTMNEYLPQAGTLLESLTTKYNAETLSKIEQVVRRSLLTGTSYREAAIELKGTMETSAGKSLRIMRTESERNLTAGNLASFRKLSASGVDAERVWVATLDNRTRDTHGALDGTIADPDGYFRANGNEVLGPGMFGDPAEDINCRCSVVVKVAGVDPEMRRAKDPVTGKSDIISWKSYDEWRSSLTS